MVRAATTSPARRKPPAVGAPVTSEAVATMESAKPGRARSSGRVSPSTSAASAVTATGRAFRPAAVRPHASEAVTAARQALGASPTSSA